MGWDTYHNPATKDDPRGGTNFEWVWDTLGGKDFLNQSIFFGGNDLQSDFYSMQYMSSLQDTDGSLTDRGVFTIVGPKRSGSWWHLDYRPGRCEAGPWKYEQYTCDKRGRHLGSMFTVVGEFTSSGTNSDVINTIVRGIDGSNSATNSEKRGTIMGTVTHFGLAGVDPAVDDCDMLYGTDDSACGPGYCRAPSDCGETLPRSWDPDLTGPYNHATYGGWYLTFHYGTPAELSITRIQMPEGSVNMQAISLPPSITWSRGLESSRRTAVCNLVGTLPIALNACWRH